MSSSNFVVAGLGDLPVPKRRLQRYVVQLRAQEDGQPPTPYKLGGNLAWYKRSKSSSYPMNQYFASLGWDKNRVYGDLKQRVPQMFTISMSSDKVKNLLLQTKGAPWSGDNGNTSTGNDQSADGGTSIGLDQSAKAGSNWLGWVLLAGGAGSVAWWIFSD